MGRDDLRLLRGDPVLGGVSARRAVLADRPRNATPRGPAARRLAFLDSPLPEPSAVSARSVDNIPCRTDRIASARTIGGSLSTYARWRTFRSSRTFPGQSYPRSASTASGSRFGMPAFSLASMRSRKCLASAAMSSFRSRSGGMKIGNTLRRRGGSYASRGRAGTSPGARSTSRSLRPGRAFHRARARSSRCASWPCP